MTGRRALIPLVVCLMVFAGDAWAGADDRRGETLQTAIATGSLTVVGTTGRTVAPSELHDRWLMVLIGYTSCPDICPYTLGSMAGVYRELAAAMPVRDLPKMVFLAVDPARDGIDEIGAYVDNFHPEFLAATGARTAIDAAVASLGGHYRLNRPDSDGFYSVDHSAFVYVLSPDGAVRAKLAPPLKAAAVRATLDRLRRVYGRAE